MAAAAGDGIDTNLYSRQLGVFGMEACVRSGDRVRGRARNARATPVRRPPPPG
jgi:hypothetical protein